MDFPRSCVLYLRNSRNTPDFLEVDVVFPDGGCHLYRVPAIKVENYTKDKIFEKSLLMLLPFYIMRYEKRGHEMSEDPQLFQELLNEYEVIRSKLEAEITESGRSELFSDLIGLITRISDHIFRNEEKVRKGIGETMGGKVLELESERLRAEGKVLGESIGEARGEARGKVIGELQGETRLGVLINRLILDGRSAEVQGAATDAEKRKELYKEYNM
mgnify:CR=1 FL=1